jgi:hypothetical protein
MVEIDHHAPIHYHKYEHYEENHRNVKELHHLLYVVSHIDLYFYDPKIYYYQVIYLLHVFDQHRYYDSEHHEDCY